EAAKQSRRARFPDITGQVSTAGAAARGAGAGPALLLGAGGGPPLRGGTGPPARGGVLVIGAQGGLRPGGARGATAGGGRAGGPGLPAGGAVRVCLGRSVLRGSTAGAVAGTLVLSGCGRWAPRQSRRDTP